MSDSANVTDTPAAVSLPAAPPPPAPPKPPPPPPRKPPAKVDTSRRFFLANWFAIGMGAMTAAIVGMLLGTVRFLFPNVLSEPPSKFKVGEPSVFEEGKVNERFKE